MQNYETESSSLNNSNFFEILKIDINNEDNYERIEFSQKLILLKMLENDDRNLSDERVKMFAEEYGNGEVENDTEEYAELHDNVTSDLYETALMYNTLYIPRIYNEETALKCSLVPFRFNNNRVLALGDCGMDLSPKLELYQFLVSGSFDNKSDLYKIIAEDKAQLENHFIDCTYESAIEDVKNILMSR